MNSTLIIGNIGSPFTIVCNGSLINNQQIIWVQTLNKTGVYIVQNSNIMSISSNGQILSFTSLRLTDEEYYSCGYTVVNNFQIINNYFLYIRGSLFLFNHIFKIFQKLTFLFFKVYPIMEFFFKNVLVYSNQTITLANNLLNTTYPIICASIDSKPDVNLTVYDTNSLIPLATTSNSVLSKTCKTTNVCTSILLVNFQFTNNLFNYMTSLTCSAISLNPQIPLVSYISRNATVLSKKNLNLNRGRLFLQ